MTRQLCIAACIVGVFYSGCVKRISVRDEAGKAISEAEIKKHQTGKNFALYTLAGGALSFGASFFIGTMINRSLDNSQNSPELWGTAGVGTVAGTIFFASQGKRKDRNSAVEFVKEDRKAEAARQLTLEQSKQQEVSQELRDLKSLRARQEAEKAKLEEEIKKKKGKNGKNF